MYPPAARLGRWVRTLEKGLRILVHSNLFISIATTSVAVTTARLVGLPLEALPLFVVFAATLFVYTVNRLTDLEEDEQNVPQRAAFTKRYGRRWLGLGSFLYLVAVVASLALGLPGTGYMLAPLLAVVLYSQVGIKRVFFLKNLFVGLAWGAIPLGVGYYYGQLWTAEILFLTGYVAAMITVAAVIFDVKDIQGDIEEGISTIPNTVGPEQTRQVAQLGNAAVAIAVVSVVTAGLVPTRLLAVLSMNAYVASYVPFATPDRGPLFYGFVVDGEHVFLAGVVVGLEWLLW
ncbi:UbiA family prenyltransferase [Natronobacterium gregoryi]|nr:UbiA family prenyltransferase [Natronobacterium gregoryi]AFZ74796.1 4-hydroxybenzoate polyprenyltransferase-like prenyltransferase [Natronobacterium gregoryi SP2]PLK19506.1 prenyltransferase [Natronobacterium gregoryi SP2]SFJ43312.1 4-hydroxybenzoate polyprenyltransferase [Natronobacterium gregoryi]